MVVPLILLFAILWYIRYYDVLQSVVFKSELENASALSEQKGGFFKKPGTRYFSVSPFCWQFDLRNPGLSSIKNFFSGPV